MTFYLSGGYERIEFDDGQNDDEYRIQPGLRYMLGPRASLFVDYSHHWQNSNNPTDEFTENRVGVGLRMDW